MSQNPGFFSKITQSLRSFSLPHKILPFLYFSIPISPRVSTFLMFLILVPSLVFSGKSFLQLLKKRRLFHPFLAFYAILIVGILYSCNIGAGLSKIQTQLSFIAFPLLIGTLVISNALKTKLFNSFNLGVFTAITICTINAFFRFVTTHSSFVLDDYGRKSSVFFYLEFTKILDLHPTYFAMYITLTIFYVLYSKKEMLAKTNSWIYYINFMVLITGLFLTSSKAGIFVFFICLLFFCITRRKFDPTFLRIIGIGLLIGVFVISLESYTKNRMLQFLQTITKIVSSEEVLHDSTGSRLYSWNLAVKVIKEAPVFGRGTGCAKTLLNQRCLDYFNFGTCEVLRDKNTHNQYLDILITNGIYGLCVFLIAFLGGLYDLKLRKDGFFILFLILLGFHFCLESVLQRERGIMFFMSIITLFFANHYTNYSSK